MSDLSLNLRVMMVKRNFKTITQLSEESGISRPTLTKIIRRNGDCSLATLIRLCETLKCDLTDLITIDRVS